MRNQRLSARIVVPAVFAVGLIVSGCSGISLPSFSGGEPPPVPDVPPDMPSKYAAEELVGRWGYAAYHKDTDRARTETAARGQCRAPYVIAKGPSGGVMMHLPDQRQPSELRLKGGPGGRSFIGPAGEAGGAQDREIVSFDGRVLVTRYLEPDAANRYGNMVYVRCAPRA